MNTYYCIHLIKLPEIYGTGPAKIGEFWTVNLAHFMNFNLQLQLKH